MTRPERSRRARLVGLLVVVALGAAAWLLRDDLRSVWNERLRPVARTVAASLAAGVGAGSGSAGPAAGVDTAAGVPEARGRPGVRSGTAQEGGRTSETGAADSAVVSGGDSSPGGAGAPSTADRGGEVPSAERPDAGSPDRGPAVDPARRLRRLFGPGGSGEVRLDSADLAMLLGPGRSRPLPPGVSDPRAVPRDSMLEASANVDLERVLGDRLPAMVRRMIGDSARVTAMMTPTVPETGVLRIRVREVKAGSTSFPRAMVPWLLRQVGLPTAVDDPSAVELRPGGGLSGARVERGALVLVREPEG